MDKTLEIIIAVTVLIMTAIAVMVLVSSQAVDFGDWSNDTQQQASRDLYQTQYRTACNCDADGTPTNQETSELESKADKEGCSWIDGNFDCEQVCS